MTSTVPIARLFYTTTGNNGLTVFFLLILLGAQLGSLFNSILACGHLIWAMARDGCLPYSSFFYKLSDNTHAPVRAIMLQLVICVLIIMPVSYFLALYLILRTHSSLHNFLVLWKYSLLASYYVDCCHRCQHLIWSSIFLSLDVH
jgi:amino acid transporter